MLISDRTTEQLKMDFEQAEAKVYDLVKTLLEEFNYSRYIVYEDLHIPNQPVQICISDCSIPEGYKDHLLTLGDELIEGLSFANTSTRTDKNKLTLWVIKKLQKYHSQTFPVQNNLKYEIQDELFESLITMQIPLFEVTKREAHTLLLSELKALTVNDRSFAFPKLIWKGEQTQLAQLFAQLIQHKWIDKPSNMKEFAETLNAIFDLSNTTLNGNANKSENLRTNFLSHRRLGFECLSSNHPFESIAPKTAK